MLQWSPEQISNYADISIDGIQRVYADKRNGGILWKNLRCQKQRRKRYGKAQIGAVHLQPPIRRDNVRLSSMLEVVSGDWEADTIIGKNHQQAVVSLVEEDGYTLNSRWNEKPLRRVIKATPTCQATPKMGAYDYFRQRAGIRRT